MKIPPLLKFLLGLSFYVVTLYSYAVPPYSPQSGERIIFVGDSITGQGENAKPWGWGHLIREGLETTNPGTASPVIMLGGSGHQVSSWMGILNKSTTQNFSLDAKNFEVKTELDQGAPVLVIMLGMNDALAPYLGDSPADLDQWEMKYQKLITALNERVQPKQIYLATVTMCTEDLNSRKNKLVDKLNEKIHLLAQENGYGVIETASSYKSLFMAGRKIKPDFHVTSDYVHPNKAGHLAIATAMLSGLGKTQEATYLKEKYFPNILAQAAKGSAGLSYELVPQTLDPAKPQQFSLTYYAYNIEQADRLQVNITLPKEWRAQSTTLTGSTGTFMLTGTPNHLLNTVTLTGNSATQTYRQQVNIPAPWLLTWNISQPGWHETVNVEKSLTPIDSALASGTDFLNAPHPNPPSPSWQLFYPSFNYTGGEDPGSVDFASLSAQKAFEAGYGARWIYSPKAREVDLKLSCRKMFSGDIFLTVWLNQETVYQDQLTKKPNKEDHKTVQLHAGWNQLVFKSNRRIWQWQSSINLAPIGNDSLEDLRFAYRPQ